MRIAWRTDNPPEERDQYLVTYDNGCIDICRWTNENRFWSNETTNWHWRSAQYCKVVAWMPLPEPYKAESEEK